MCADVEAKGNSVIVNGRVVLSFTGALGDSPPEIRAALAAGNLESVPTATTVTLRHRGDLIDLLVGGLVVATVDAAEAKRQNTSPEGLAQNWSSKLESALTMPNLEVDTSDVLLPVGGQKGLSLAGQRASQAVVTSTDSAVVRADLDTGKIQLKAIAPGSASVTVKAGKDTEIVNVRVRPYAGSVPDRLETEVTGSPAVASAVAGAVTYALRTHIEKEPGADIRIASFDAPVLAENESRTIAVRYRISAPDTFERVGYINVSVKNVAIPRQPDGELWYCNDPEVVRSSRNLFAGDLRKGVPARLLYHHVNGTSVPLYIRIQAINDTDEPARLLLIPGDAAAVGNPVKAGADAADLYLRSWVSDSREVITLPPRMSIPISLRQIQPGQTASGLCGISLLDGPDEILVRADSWPPFRLDDRWKAAVSNSAPWRAVGANPINGFDTAGYQRSTLIFPNPYKSVSLNYRVGGRHGFVRIGQQPIARPEFGLNLDGNFGVIYSIATKLENPTAAATDVEIVFEASAGYSAGVFWMGGAVVKTPLLFPRQTARIAKVHLEPGASKVLTITTLPLSGSSYPATITARPIVVRNP